MVAKNKNLVLHSNNVYMYPQRFVREGSELRKGFQKKIQNVNFFPKGGGGPQSLHLII